MPKQRRGKGEGCITERRDGTWMFSVRLGRGHPRKCIYAETRALLLRKIADERAAGRGTFRPIVKNTIGEWVEGWLENEKRPNLARSTFAVYEVAWRIHAKPLIEHQRLEKFSPDDVTGVYAALRKKKVGGRTIQVVAKVLRGAFDAAIHHEKYHRANPWAAVPVPRHDYKEPHVLTEQESQRFVEAARHDRFEAVWLLSLFGGLRLGECLGLQWRGVDFDSGRVDIWQQLAEVNGHLEIDLLRRRVPGERSSSVVLRWTPCYGGRPPHGRKAMVRRSFFTDERGAFLNRTYVRRRHFQKVAEAAGITGVHPHDLRHTMTSHALAAGVSAVVVSRRLGHGSTRMTLDRYGHQLPGAQAEAAAVIEGRLAVKKVVKMVVDASENSKQAPRQNGKTLAA
jgi:integrase